MAKCVFNSCCGFIDLRLGCLIIGYLQSVGGIIETICTLVFVIQYGMAVGILFQPSSLDSTTVIIAAVVLIPFVVSIFLLLLLIKKVAFTVALLYGLHKGKRGPVKVYLIFSMVFLAVFVILASIFFLYLFHLLAISAFLIELALDIYSLLVVRSYYYKMGTDGPVYSEFEHSVSMNEPNERT